MIGINSTFNNSFVNLNIKNNNNSSLNSNTNVKNLQDTKQYSKTSNKVLDYEIDNEGYFTSDFNEKAGIPKDIKIHSSTMENFIKAQNNGSLKSYANIDIAKTVGNVYKIVSQLVEKTPQLKGKSSFSKEDLANYFPQNYLIDKNTLEVKQTFSYEEMKNIIAKGGFKNINENEKLSPSFFNFDNTDEKSELLPFNPDILHSAKNTALSWDTSADKYTNNDGSITMGGLLIGFLSNNVNTGVTAQPLIAGETTIWGKLQGLDNSLSKNEIKELNNKLSNTYFSNLSDAFALLNGTSDIKEFENKLNSLNQNNKTNSSNFLEWVRQITKEHQKSLFEILKQPDNINKIYLLINIDIRA
ncbi:hypothetical protein AAID97_00270 [Campylobacter coli]|nr:hypothetical protein [Campylobacter jejuni]